MLLTRSPSALVACNIYVSAGRSQYSDILISILERCMERCQLLRLGQTELSSKKYFNQYTRGATSRNKQIAVIHAYSDQVYDRSSFHLAGNADLVADVASSLAIDAISSLKDIVYENEINAKSSDKTMHPLIGIVDHISVMPLVTENNDKNTKVMELSQNEIIENHESYTPPDSHGICSAYIGNRLKENGINVFYYGSAHPNQTPLAVVRREKTQFFNSGGLDDDDNNGIKNQCTVGSPSNFVENFNILLSNNINKKKAMGLTRKIRARDGGLVGVEALTLPYSDGRYEVACNLLCPEEGSVSDILQVVDTWVLEEQQLVGKDKLDEGTSKEYFVDCCYRVGTTAQQCLDIMENCSEGKLGFFVDYDIALSDRFRQYLAKV